MSTRLLFDDLFREPLAAPPTGEIGAQRAAPKSPRAVQAEFVQSGEQLKQAGMAKAVQSNESAVGYARELARDIAASRPDRCCHMGLVNEALAAEGKPGLGNAAGGVFVATVWEWTGERVKDTRRHAHANELKVWRLKH